MNSYLGFTLTECYIDTMLIQLLLGNKVNHQHSCNNVINNMRNKFNDDFAIGIIDNDKQRVSYLDEFQEIGATRHLHFHSHPNGKHYIITIGLPRKAIDSFVLDCASDINLSMSSLGLPKTLKDFTRIAKDEKIYTDRRIKQLLSAIQWHDEIVKLKNVLCYLLQARYNASANEIMTLVQ